MITSFRDGDLVVSVADPRPRKPFIVNSAWSSRYKQAVAMDGDRAHSFHVLAVPEEEAEREAYLESYYRSNP